MKSAFEEEFQEMKLTTMSRKQCEQIHEASLHILHKTGVSFQCDEALELFRKAGARVDGDKVFLSPGLVEWALQVAPKRFNLHDREGTLRHEVGGRNSLFGSGSDCLNLLDRHTGERRPPVQKDLRELVTLCDALPNIDFVMSMVIPQDFPSQAMDRFQMDMMLNHTTKPIIGVSFSYEGTRDIIEMCEIVAGGEENLRKNPFMIHYIQPVRSLLHNEDTVLKLLHTARKGMPVVYLVSGMMGFINPITPAGYLAMGGAGQLAALVLAQLVREGTPVVVRGGRVVVVDMRTMLSTFADPSNRNFVTEMAHYYDLPCFGTAGCSDSKSMDWQAAAEAGMTILADATSGANLIHDSGYIDSGVTYSAEMLVLCDEIISWVRSYKKSAAVNEETLALDLIDEIGIHGDFLTSDHTLEHFKEQWEPSLFDRNQHGRWKELGALDTRSRGNSKIDELLAGHKSPGLTEVVKRKLRAVIERQ
jgi:trimethylamine--corrinoid protein Co-methyltransferase